MQGVAAIMATSVRHIQRLVSERRIPYLKVGHFVRFDQAEIVAWLDERRVQVHVSSYERHRGQR
jgi:excisionase family DNA binding protein